MKTHHHSMMILCLFILVWIFQYFFNMSFEIKENNLKKVSQLRIGRLLAEAQSCPLTTETGYICRSGENLTTWLESLQGDLLTQIEKNQNNFTCNNTDSLINWMSNKTMEMAFSLNRNSDIKEKGILNNAWGIWNNLIECVKDYFSYIVDKFSCKITSDNISNITDWMYNRSRLVIRELNLDSDIGGKKVLNDTLSVWRQITKSVTNFIMESQINSTMSIDPTKNSSDLLSTPVLPTTSDSLSTSSSLITGTSSNISSNISLNDSINGIKTTPILEIITTTLGDINTSPGNDGSTTTACSGFFCGSIASISISVPLVVIGGVLFLTLLYKYTRIGSLLGRGNLQKEKGRKRLRETSLDNIEDPSESSMEKEEMKPKRSRLNSFLRAFGYKYRNIFPYIDENR
ncbi:PIR-like protein [Plasmodium gallinaceum]|uniref:PIR-like protein n=1 Tax=Plasmodium gallinaceum TaxID=5849 RepID=A0A1J1GSL7_PLAGA|nr:PIR-like protein [Plasmodium gallinaceum]CRG95483.1 PIR-like protein [Plasmodium gallinaceum]